MCDTMCVCVPCVPPLAFSMNDAVIGVIQSALHVIDVVYIVVRVRAACVSAASKCVDSINFFCGHIQHIDTVPLCVVIMVTRT